MEVIKIALYVLGMFFGIEDSRIASEKTTITINPITKLMVIENENLFTIIRNEEDSIAVAKELFQIMNNPSEWRSELEKYPSKKIEFTSVKEGVLNAKLTLEYNDYSNLSDYAIDVNPEGKYSIVNIPNWNLKTTDGKLNGNYWNFDASKPFTFTLEPFLELPEEYQSSKRSLFSIWKNNK